MRPVTPGHTVEITVDPDRPGNASVKVDGVERNNAIHHHVGERPDIVLLDAPILFDGMRWLTVNGQVGITPETAELLIALGWTPPPDQHIPARPPQIDMSAFEHALEIPDETEGEPR